jgi:hypothetical protein
MGLSLGYSFGGQVKHQQTPIQITLSGKRPTRSGTYLASNSILKRLVIVEISRDTKNIGHKGKNALWVLNRDDYLYWLGEDFFDGWRWSQPVKVIGALDFDNQS